MSDEIRGNELFARPTHGLRWFFSQFLPPQPRDQRVFLPQSADLHITYRDLGRIFVPFISSMFVFGVEIVLVNWMVQPLLMVLVRLLVGFKLFVESTIFGNTFSGFLNMLTAVILVGIIFYRTRDDIGVALLDSSIKDWPRMCWQAYDRRLTNHVTVEEQCYREGNERWSPHQRMTSSIVFGLSFILKPWYPLASYLTMMMLGHTLQQVYREELRATGNLNKALLRVTALHKLHRLMCRALTVPYVVLVIVMLT